MMGLGYLGKKEYKKAKDYLQEAFDLDNNHQGVLAHLVV
jgi:Tfp pilus assembly protein PilF